MRRRMQEYLAYIDELLKDGKDHDWDNIRENHLIQIRFFAHERLVHLIVFSLVGVCTVLSILCYVAFSEIVLLPLIVLLFILLIPYCLHYYFLENGVQKMYRQYDEILGKTRRDSFRQSGKDEDQIHKKNM